MVCLRLESGSGFRGGDANALLESLARAREARQDLWIEWRPGSVGELPGGLFRAGLVCLVGLSGDAASAPVNVRFRPTAATVVCYDALRFVDLDRLTAVSPMELLADLEQAFDAYGFSTYLAPIRDAQSEDATVADYIVRNNLLRKEREPWRVLQLVGAVKQSPARKKSELSLVLDLSSLPRGYCGTSEFPVSMLRAIMRVRDSSRFRHVRLLAAPRALRAFDLEGLCEAAERNRIYDVLYRPSKLSNPLHLLNALKISRTQVVTHFDSIASRCAYIAEPGQRLIEEVLLAACDGAVFLSEYAQSDTENLMRFDHLPPLRHVLFAWPRKAAQARGRLSRPPGPFVVIGNTKHPHKYLPEALGAIHKAQEMAPAISSRRFVFLGDLSGRELPPNVSFCANNLAPHDFANLLESCSGIIYPSVYEGLGLPFLHALNYGKPVLAADYEHNRNMQRVFPDLALSFYASLQELPARIVEFVSGVGDASPLPVPADDIWDMAAAGLLQFLETCAAAGPARATQIQALQSLFIYQGMLATLTHMSGMSFEELILKAKGNALFGPQ